MISSSVTATSATLSFSQPTNSLSVDMYTFTLAGTTCNGVPTRTGSTTSNSVTIGNLEAGIQYSVAAVARNNLAELEGTGSATLTTSETGELTCYIRHSTIDSGFFKVVYVLCLLHTRTFVFLSWYAENSLFGGGGGGKG